MSITATPERKLRSQNTENYDADGEVNSLYSAITGRRAFSYDAASDPAYRSYEQRYTQNGRMAMRDAMGQAASLTGGYSSTYSQSAGQQQHDEYLRSLSEVLPELYSQAYRRYSDEGDALRDSYDMAYQRRETEYQRSRDEASDRRYAEEQSYDRTRESNKSLSSLISTSGYTPTDAELASAGMTRAQADALISRYLLENDLGPKTTNVTYIVKNSGRKSASSKTSKAYASGRASTNATK